MCRYPVNVGLRVARAGCRTAIGALQTIDMRKGFVMQLMDDRIHRTFPHFAQPINLLIDQFLILRGPVQALLVRLMHSANLIH